MRKILIILTIVALCFTSYIIGYNTTTSTTNLELVKPASEDETVDWFDTMNDNLDLIDANNPQIKIDATTSPTVNNDTTEDYTIGSLWYDITNDKAYVCLDATDGAAVWTETTQAGGGSGTVDTSGTPVANDIPRFTDANTIEGLNYAELKAALDLEIGTDILAEQTIGIADNNLVEIDHASVADDDYSKFTANGLEGRSYSEIRTDLGLVIGTNIQAFDDALTNISALTYVSPSYIKLTANDTYAVRTLAEVKTDLAYQLSDMSDVGVTTPTDTHVLVADGDSWESRALADGDIPNTITISDLQVELDAGAHSIGFTQQSTTGDGTTTIDWKLGNKFEFTFGAQNDTFTFTAPTNPCTLMLTIIQDGTGSRTLTWPATVKWPGGTEGVLTTTANARDKVALDWDGSQYDAVISKDFK